MPVPDTAQEAQQSAAALAERAALEIRTLWSDLEGADAAMMRDRIMGVLPSIVRPHYEAASALATDWYTANRPKSAPKFKLSMAEELGDARLRSMVGEALAPLFELGTNRNFTWAQQRTEGLIEEVVLTGFRETIQINSTGDAAVDYWVRVVSPGKCDWCRKFAGEKYYKAGQFKSHHHCRCTNAPHFKEEYVKKDKADATKAKTKTAKAAPVKASDDIVRRIAEAEARIGAPDVSIPEVLRLSKELQELRAAAANKTSSLAKDAKVAMGTKQVTAVERPTVSLKSESQAPRWAPGKSLNGRDVRWPGAGRPYVDPTNGVMARTGWDNTIRPGLSQDANDMMAKYIDYDVAIDINTELRTGKVTPGVAKQIKLMDQGMNLSAQKNVVVHRAMIIDDSLAAFKTPGSVVHSRGYLSTTTDPTFADRFLGMLLGEANPDSYVVDIQLQDGTRFGVGMYGDVDNFEAVLQRDLDLHIVSVDEKTKRIQAIAVPRKR